MIRLSGQRSGRRWELKSEKHGIVLWVDLALSEFGVYECLSCPPYHLDLQTTPLVHARNYTCSVVIMYIPHRTWVFFQTLSLQVASLCCEVSSIRFNCLSLQDMTRPYWPSSPSNGYLVDDKELQLFIQRWGKSQNVNYGDIHRCTPSCSQANISLSSQSALVSF